MRGKGGRAGCINVTLCSFVQHGITTTMHGVEESCGELMMCEAVRSAGFHPGLLTAADQGGLFNTSRLTSWMSDGVPVRRLKYCA